MSDIFSISCSWDNIWVTGDPMLDKGLKEKILDMIGGGCIYFNVNGFFVSW